MNCLADWHFVDVDVRAGRAGRIPSAIMRSCVLGILAVAPVSTLQARQAQFTPLGDLPGGAFASFAQGVSEDGAVVVGSSESTATGTGLEAFRWTATGGMVGLGGLPGSMDWSSARGVSADGTVVVGSSKLFSVYPEAFRWSASGGMVGLGDLPGADMHSYGYAVSADGSVVVGRGQSALVGDEAFRWTAAGGMVGLGVLWTAPPWSQSQSTAHGVSADGYVVVGDSYNGTGWEAFRWTATGGMVGLGDIPGGDFYSKANAASADGSVVVGYGTYGNPSNLEYEAFRWTAAGGMVGLGDLPGGRISSEAKAVNADGSMVVGWSFAGWQILDAEAFLWTPSAGMINLRDRLITQGATGLTGWVLHSAHAINADGTAIVGYGTNPSGQYEAWLAVLTPFYTSMCSGDGSGTTCPCGNAGGQGEGCGNSSGAGGLLSAQGSNSDAADDLILIADQLVPSQSALLFAGINAINGGNGAPFGDGLRCAGGDVVRLGIRTPNAGGGATWGPGLGSIGAWGPGDVRRFQGWYRDPGGPCASGFNLTNGLEVTFTP